MFTARYVLPAQYIYVLCLDLRTNSDYFLVQRQPAADAVLSVWQGQSLYILFTLA